MIVNVIFYVARCGKPHSWLIGLFTKSKQHKIQYSHVEISLGDGITVGCDEATGGVSMKTGVDISSGCWAVVPIDLPRYEEARSFFLRTEGCKYDWQRIGMIATSSLRQLFNYGKSKIFKDVGNKYICNEWALDYLVWGGIPLTRPEDTSNPNELYDEIARYREVLRVNELH